MKKNFLFAMAIAAAFTACSDDNEAMNNPSAEVAGEGYIALSINLPTQNSSRAFSESSDLKDGLVKEYEVQNAQLIIFNGTSDEATWVQTISLTDIGFSNNNDDPNQITQTSLKVVKKVSSSVQAGYGMLVVLNDNSTTLFSDLTATTKFSEVLEKTSEKIKTVISESSGLLMTNAPLATKTVSNESSSWTDGEIQTLVGISKVYETMAAAQAGTADQIYVERAVAKVTMQGNKSGSLTTGKIGAEENTLSYTITGWNLGNTNTSSYLVRNASTSDFTTWATLKTNDTGKTDAYRFIGTNIVTGSQLYRTYFAKDPNYSEDADLANAIDVVTSFGDENPLYCYENTFNVTKMTQKNTTHVVIEAQLGTAGEDGNFPDLYVVNDEKSKIYNDQDDLKNLVYNVVVNTMKEYLKTGSTGNVEDLQVSFQDITSPSDNTNYNVTALSIVDESSSKYVEGIENALTGMVEKVNSAVKIAKYTDGKSYYAARIKHFGDDFTPWNSKETTKPGGDNGVYPTGGNQDANYLGRYGVLRNNWYDINVTGIKMIGDTSVEILEKNEDGTDTDDELDNYVTFQINILSWAKRSQEVEL